MMPDSCPLNLLHLSISFPCCQLHTFTPQYRQNTRKLVFHYAFQQAHESQSHSPGSLYLLFLMQSVKIPEEQHMTLEGEFLEDGEQKASAGQYILDAKNRLRGMESPLNTEYRREDLFWTAL